MMVDPLCSPSASAARWMVVLISALALLAVLAPPARADGDPASDVLAVQKVFLPADASASTGHQVALSSAMQRANSRGFLVRVAVITSPADLGSVAALWRRPQTYAQFLGHELSLIFSGQVLVVMPDGFGVYHAGRHKAAELAALHRLPVNSSADLSVVAAHAVMATAGAAGTVLTNIGSPPRSTAAGSADTPGPVSWSMLAAGAALVALAWTVSLRARPWRPVKRRSSTRPAA